MNNYSYRKDNRTSVEFMKDIHNGDYYNFIFADFLRYLFDSVDISIFGIKNIKVGIESKRNRIISDNLKDYGDVAIAVEFNNRSRKCFILEISASPFRLSDGSINKSSDIKGRLKTDSFKKIAKEEKILVCIKSKKENEMCICIPKKSYVKNIPFLFSEINIRKDSNKKCYEIIYKDLKPWYNIDFRLSKEDIIKYCSYIFDIIKEFSNHDILNTGYFDEVKRVKK
jgi:hypothetical protein